MFIPTTRQQQEFIRSITAASLLEDAIEWIKSHLNPEEVFGEQALAEWAEENGWKKLAEEP
jgi:hypothetical protein